MTGRTNSDSGRNQIARNAIRKASITPPAGVQMSKDERKTFDNLASEFALEEISPHKIELLVVVAKTLTMVAEQQNLLTAEGAIVHSPSGVKPNPRYAIINSALASVVKMRRSLGLGNYSKSLRDVAIQRDRIKAQEAGVLSLLDDPIDH